MKLLLCSLSFRLVLCTLSCLQYNKRLILRPLRMCIPTYNSSGSERMCQEVLGLLERSICFEGTTLSL